MTGNPDAESIVDQNGNVKNGKLGTLARAYPERIAGSAARWSFDPGTARFELRWRAARGETVVRLPRLQYPRGYELTLKGARLVRAGATLRLRGRGRPARVLVTQR